MKQVKTLTFSGIEYNIVEMDEESVSKVPGVETTVTSLSNHANATLSSFIDELEVRDRHWHFSPGDVVLDVGAAFGSYTLTAALQGASVFAFEPCLFCRSILKANVEVNSKLSNNIQIVPFGLYGKGGWFNPNTNVLSDKPTPECLEVTPLDDIENSDISERISMIKIDVEGGELSVLQGAEKTITRYLPHLLIEEHEFKISGIGRECEEFLSKIGYSSPIRFPHHDVSHSFYESPIK